MLLHSPNKFSSSFYVQNNWNTWKAKITGSRDPECVCWGAPLRISTCADFLSTPEMPPRAPEVQRAPRIDPDLFLRIVSFEARHREFVPIWVGTHMLYMEEMCLGTPRKKLEGTYTSTCTIKGACRCAIIWTRTK